MKKLYTTLLLVSLASLPAAAQEIVDAQCAKEIYDAFTATLNEGVVPDVNDAHLSQADIPQVREAVWNIWRNAVEDYDEEKLIGLSVLEERNSGTWTLPSELEEGTMPYYYGCNEYPAFDAGKRYPLFLYMHGSGDKNTEWETGIGLCLRRFYSPAIYFVPQIPNAYGEYYRWAIQSKQWAWEKLLRLAYLSDNVDPDKVYFFGISEGGYGSQRLASFYADYLAGAGPMAGGEPLKNAPMENVANIAFSLRTGELDSGFGRNILTAKALEVADALEKEHPGYYIHNIEVIPDYGHSIDYSPTTPWLAQYTRDPHPDYVYWENFAMYGRYRTGFYNLRVIENATSSSVARACYEMSREGNIISLNAKIVNYSTSYSSGGIDMYFNKKYSNASKGKLRIYLNEEEYDLSKPVTLLLNGKEIFSGIVTPTLGTMVESCALFFDPERLFPAAIDVDIAAKSAEPTSLRAVTEDAAVEDDAIYDLSGRRVEGTLPKGIYIRGGKAVLVE